VVLSAEREAMAMARLTVVTVTLTDREDGGLQVHSDDLPGLILSGSDKSKVAAAIIPAIRAIFKHKGMDVGVLPTKPIAEVLRSKSPRDMDLHVQHEQFVIELPEAA
jgi:hypothetical protein